MMRFTQPDFGDARRQPAGRGRRGARRPGHPINHRQRRITSAGGTYTVIGSIGQPDAGELSRSTRIPT